MDEQSERTALLSALTTEHFVLQTANNSTYAEASARSTLYVMALSSSLVAMGFVAGSRDVLIPFAAIVLPAIFVLGIFTVVRLVETSLDSRHCLRGIARIRAYYRTLGTDAARHSRLSVARGGKSNHRRSVSVPRSRFSVADVAVLRIPTLAFRRR